MERHVHFYIVGSKPETAFIAVDKIPLDKMYVLNNDSKDFSGYEDEVVSGFHGIKKQVEVVRANPFDYYDVFQKAKAIADRELSENPDVFFHMNITMGARPGACALSNVAYSFHSELYYIQEAPYSPTKKDELIRIGIDNLSIIYELKKKPKTLEVLLRFIDSDCIPNSELVEVIGSPTSLSYHTKYLCDNGLIERDGIRNAKWRITDLGSQVLKRL
ncbi:MAG: DUF6293 family protein [Gudongella sp.]|jgi:DNA-binding transcriptional ArsR family regulator|nr:DUF6293 family protein [Gudongella sp.]